MKAPAPREPKGHLSDARLAEIDSTLRRSRELSLQYREIEHEITRCLQNDRLTFEDAARLAETLGRDKHPWVQQRLAYTASLWRSRGSETWSGKPVQPEAVESAQRVGL